MNNSLISENRLPSGWEFKNLKDITCSFKSGFSITSENISEDTTLFPVYGGNGLRGYTSTFTHDSAYTLIGRQGALCGNLNYVEGKSFISEHAIAVKANNENETKFLYYNFSRLNLNKLSEASAQPGLSVEKLLKLETLVPPLAEQQKIAQALTDADNYISALEKLIEKKKMIKEGLMANLLTGKQRLKEFAFNEDGTAKGYKDSELGKIPEDWDLYNLDEIADVIDPHPSHRAPPIDRDGIPFLGIGDFSTDGKIINNNPRLVNISVFKEHRERYQLEDNLIGLGRVASIGKVIRLNANEKYSISPTLGIIRGTSVSNDLIFYLLSSRFVSLQFNRILSGSTRSSVGMNVLREVKIALPQSPKEQLSLGKLLIDIDQDIQKLESKYQKSHDLKQGMMQKLLTGEIRLV